MDGLIIPTNANIKSGSTRSAPLDFIQAQRATYGYTLGRLFASSAPPQSNLLNHFAYRNSTCGRFPCSLVKKFLNNKSYLDRPLRRVLPGLKSLWLVGDVKSSKGTRSFRIGSRFCEDCKRVIAVRTLNVHEGNFTPKSPPMEHTAKRTAATGRGLNGSKNAAENGRDRSGFISVPAVHDHQGPISTPGTDKGPKIRSTVPGKNTLSTVCIHRQGLIGTDNHPNNLYARKQYQTLRDLRFWCIQILSRVTKRENGPFEPLAGVNVSG